MVSHPFEIARPPALVEPPLQRRVEPEDDVKALARPRLDPVAFLPGGRFGPNHTVIEPSAFFFTSGQRAVETRGPLVGLEE